MPSKPTPERLMALLGEQAAAGLARLDVRRLVSRVRAATSAVRATLESVAFREAADADPVVAALLGEYLARPSEPPADALPDFCGPGRAPSSPTDYPPGSPGKLLVMQERAAAGQTLFHSRDRREHREGDAHIEPRPDLSGPRRLRAGAARPR